MRSKIHAAKMASLSGIRAVIANATHVNVLVEAVNGGAVGTTVEASERGLSARKLWIGFAVDPQGTLVVDAGAQDALVNRNVSLLPAGVVRVTGDFEDGAAVNIANADGSIFARGLVRFSSRAAAQAVGKRSADLPEDAPSVMVHRDDLVVIS
jgi:glutamate 5-kinase